MLQPKFPGIVEESLKCQIFGQFGQNYGEFMKLFPNSDKQNTFLNYFAESEILTDEYPLYKALLYFNLPFDSIIKELAKPKLIFKFDSQLDSGTDSKLDKIIEEFEGIRNGRDQMIPNIILMKVPLGSDQIDSQAQIVGGYASQGWNVSGGTKADTKCKGDMSCFLFNLTYNLRFNAREGMPYYQNVDKDELRFGNTDLVLRGGFQNVTSTIVAPSSSKEEGRVFGRTEETSGSHFCFGNDLTQKNKVESIIPETHKFAPSKLEVWAFTS